jgi:hypothetical protein
MDSLSDLSEYFGPPTLQDVQTMLTKYDLQMVLDSDKTEPTLYGGALRRGRTGPMSLHIILDLANNPKPQSDLVQLVQDPPPELGTPAYYNELQTYSYIERNQMERNARSGRPLTTYRVSSEPLEQLIYTSDIVEGSRARNMDRTGDITADFDQPSLIPGGEVQIVVETPFNDEFPFWYNAQLYTRQYNVSVGRDTIDETQHKCRTIFWILDLRMTREDIKMFCDYCMGRFTAQDHQNRENARAQRRGRSRRGVALMP